MISKLSSKINSGNTKLKVALGYLILLLVVFSLVYITYNSFHKILNSLETLSTNKDESEIIQNIASDLNEMRMSAKIYSMSFKPADLHIYSENTTRISMLIDSLKHQSAYKNRYEKVDSLENIFKDYVSSVNTWLTLKSVVKTNDFEKIAKLIREGGDSLIRIPGNIPHSNITTVTKTIEKPLLNASGTDSAKTGTVKAIFQKVFGGGKKKNQTPSNTSVYVNQQVVSETSTLIDSGYYNKVGMLITKTREALATTEYSKKIRNSQLEKLEMRLLNYQSEMISKINYLLKSIEHEDQVLLNQKVGSSTETMQNATRNLMYVQVLALIVTLVFIYNIFTDLTRNFYYKRMLENAKLETEKLAKAKEDFLASMSHEIRSPLTSIIGFSEQLGHTDLQEDQRRQVQSIVNSSEHLLAVVNDILDYSKIQSGALKFEKSGFTVNDIVTEVMDILRLETDKKNLQLLYKPGSGSDIILSGDPFRLKQVLINLVSNGIKFTPKGFVVIESLVIESAYDCLLRCTVRDTGIGIAKEKLEIIFADFSQADNSTARNYGGTGLGLSISKKIIELQNGTIGVESEEGKGSAFTFDIPYTKAFRRTYKSGQDTAYQSAEVLKNKKIILIDDDPMIPMLIEPAMKKWNMDYTFCNSPLYAWEILQNQRFDIIMIDMQMPEMDGSELISKIVANDKSVNKNTKIIVSTANVQAGTHQLTTSMHNQVVFLYKPYKMYGLKDALHRSLSTFPAIQINPEPDDLRSIPAKYSLKNFIAFANKDITTLELFIRTYIEQTKNELSQIKTAFRQKNYTEVQKITHKLINTCGQLEAIEMLNALKHLEKLVLNENVVHIKTKKHIDYLISVSQELFKYLEMELSHIRSDYKSIS